METRQLFNKKATQKVVFSSVEIDPSISPFIKHRLEVLLSSASYVELLTHIERQEIRQEEFNVEYLALEGDHAAYPERRSKVKDVGYRIEGEPNFADPATTYAIATFDGAWYFGLYKKHDHDWQKHKKKPRSFSNSISMDIAKTLVSMASKGNKRTRLLDACCGVGTVILEACFADFNIEGCDINWSACQHTLENLAYFGYDAEVYCKDINDLELKYDAAIIDLPYNLYSYSNNHIALNIIKSTANLTTRIVLVSIADIAAIIDQSGLKVTDYCTVEKPGKSKFVRKIWICEKDKKDAM